MFLRLFRGASRRRAPRRRSLGRRSGSPACRGASRRPGAVLGRASTSAIDGLGTVTSTQSPNSGRVLAVCGPMTPITVTACGFHDADQVPHGEDEVNSASVEHAALDGLADQRGRGAARACGTRSRPRPPGRGRWRASSVWVAMSGMSSGTQLIGSSRSSFSRSQMAARPSADWSPSAPSPAGCRTRAATCRGLLADGGDLHAGERPWRDRVPGTVPRRAHRVRRGEGSPLVAQ